MWAKRIWQSKFLKIVLIAMVLAMSFHASYAKAIGLDTAVKIVAGSSAQKVVRSIGEKAGMAFTPKSLQATTDYINGQAAKGNQKYIDLAKGVNTAAGTGTAHATKPGWKKYALDPILWLTGADLLVEAYDAFNDAQGRGDDVDFYGDDEDDGAYCYKQDFEAEYAGGVKVLEDGFYLGHKQATAADRRVQSYKKENKASCDVTQVTYSTWNAYHIVNVTYMIKYGDVDYQSFSTQIYVDGPNRYTGSDTEFSRKTSDDDEVNMSNVTNADTYRNTIDNDDYSRVTYDNDIEIYAPDTDTTANNDYTTPWNTKMDDEEFNIIVKPIQDVDVVVPPSDDDDDDLPTGPRPDPVEVLDRSVLDVLVKSYKYLDDAIDAAVSSMRTVADGATGIGDFLNSYMGWLPTELRTTIVALMMVGVFAHFFRR